MSDSVDQPLDLNERVLKAVRRNRDVARLSDSMADESLEHPWQAFSVDKAIGERLRRATLNLMQDAIEARHGQEAAAADRARLQAAFRERDAQLRLALELADIGTFSWDARTMRCEADERLRKWCGWMSESQTFTSVPQLIPVLDAPAFEQALRGALAPEGDGQLRGDFAVRAPDGIRRWLSITAQVEFTGEPRRAILMRGAVLDITERKNAEVAMRASEERFRQFAAASSDVLWIRDAATLELEFVSDSFAAVYGAPTETVQAPESLRRWASLIVPDDRARVLELMSQARSGEPVVYEYRILRPSDGQFRWIRHTEFPLRGTAGEVQRVAGIASDITDSRQLLEHQGVLVAELQHRVRNIMAMIRALASRTSLHAADVASYTEVLTGRILSMARTQALLTRSASSGVDIRQIVLTELGAPGQSDQYTTNGPHVVLAPKAAEVLTLVIHELTTNAIKYGAFSPAGGTVDTEWETFERDGQTWLGFTWHERRGHHAPSGTNHPGFGSELIEKRVPYELRGSGALHITADGAHCRVEFPLRAGASVLETTAPRPAQVHGGSLDVRGDIDLKRARVLIVDDDFYLAADAKSALTSAGATIQGPYASAEQARAAIAAIRPDCAVLDINLGEGPDFSLAEQLREAQVPFIFITGYDHDAIPGHFSDVRCLHKPVEFRALIETVAELVQGGTLPAVAGEHRTPKPAHE